MTEGQKSDKISGAQSGVINPASKRGERKADALYEQIRKSDTDIASITLTIKELAPDLSITFENIKSIKKHLFFEEHDLIGGIRRFDPDADMADSWIRLKNGVKSALPHDMTMIRHELCEMQLVAQGIPREKAHEIAESKYNYGKECLEYHGQTHKRKMRG